MGLYISISIFLIAVLCLELLTKRKISYKTFENSTLPKEYKHTHSQIAFFLFVMLLLWFLTAFRSEYIGSDTIQYFNHFKAMSYYGKISFNSRFEIGYQILTLIISKINPNPYFFLGVIATICYLATGIYIYKYSDNIVFSTVLVFPIAYGFFATGLRQAIAMVIILYAYQAIKNNKNILAFLIILFAATFHTSALIALFLLLHKIIPKKPIIIIPLSAILIIFSLAGFMDDILSAILPFYAGYYENEIITDGWLGITYYCLRNIVFYILVYLSYKKSQKQNCLALSNFVILFLTTCFGFSLSLFSRATNYFLLICIVELPNAIYRGRLPYKKIFVFLIGFIMVLYFVVTLIIRPDWNTLCPYKFFWN
ncbi:MAG: EpsG family protein [Clostridia bacterium]|nr:EpsG family protein [Clostridia bacterium]